MIYIYQNIPGYSNRTPVRALKSRPYTARYMLSSSSSTLLSVRVGVVEIIAIGTENYTTIVAAIVIFVVNCFGGDYRDAEKITSTLLPLFLSFFWNLPLDLSAEPFPSFIRWWGSLHAVALVVTINRSRLNVWSAWKTSHLLPLHSP